MKIIEFVGPAGIGKTTILKELKKRNKNEIIDKHEAALLAIKDNKKLINRKWKVLLYLICLIPIKRFRRIFSGLIIDHALSKSFEIKLKKYEIIVSLYMKRLYKKEREMEVYKLKSFLVFINWLKYFILCNESKIEKNVIFDEGIAKKSMAYNYKGNIKEVEHLLPRKLIAFDVLDDNTYVQRRLGRSKKLFNEHGLSKSELKKKALQTLNHTRRQIKYFEKSNFDITIINTDRNMNEVINDVEKNINLK